MRQHISKEHQISSYQIQDQRQLYSPVTLQYFFSDPRTYFIVQPSTVTTSSSIITQTDHLSQPPTNVPPSQDSAATLSGISLTFRSLHDLDKSQYRQINDPNHVSQLSPFMRTTRCHEHVAGLDGALIQASWVIPRKASTDANLYWICQSIHRVLQQAYTLIRHLHHVAARTLNSFQTNTISQDPFTALQNKQSLSAYISTFQALLCYVIRVYNGHFEIPPFEFNTVQSTAILEVLEATDRITTTMTPPQRTQPQRETRHRALPRTGVPSPTETPVLGTAMPSPGSGSDYEVASSTSDDLQPEPSQLDLDALDHQVLHLLVILLFHNTESEYDSPVISFSAVYFTRVHPTDYTVSFQSEADIGGILSKLIYCCQLVLLQHAHNTTTPSATVGTRLETICRQWMQNDTYGPIGTLLSWRLYAMKVGRSTVPPGLVRWDDDDLTMTYADTRYSLSDMKEEMLACFLEAQEIFCRDLCLGFQDVPSYNLHELMDNWSNPWGGYSFISDSRNSTLLYGHDEWLAQQIVLDANLVHLVYQTDRTDLAPGTWPIRSTFAKQMQLATVRFLELMLVLVHKGSGMPARRPEFLGTGWRNSELAQRNLRLHSGHLLFILTYHKTQAMTHASRSPVRFIVPPVAQLLVQFLIIIQPFRRLCAQSARQPSSLGDYLWSSDSQPWDEDRMTRILQENSRRVVGRAINVRVWRQMCAAIAIKKFSGRNFASDMDLPGNADDLLTDHPQSSSVNIAASFHAQSARSAYTGNRTYGGSVNFNNALTDAGLQVYRWTSTLWWTLFEDVFTEAPEGHKRLRPRSMAAQEPSLAKRVAHHTRPSRQRRQHGTEAVLTALRRLYRDPTAKFRSPAQQELVESVALGRAEVVGVLGTGTGKSLAFLVPIFLPAAATTVVIVPLVALKADLVRRCHNANIAYSIWDPHRDQASEGTPLLFVSADHAVREPFQRHLGLLDAGRQLDRIVIDECHLILTASTYRPKMSLLRQLRDFRCPIVCLTATLPPVMTNIFVEHMFLERPTIIRTPTFRSDLCYIVHRQTRPTPFTDYMISRIQSLLRRHEADEAARLILYVTRKETAREMAGHLGCEFYYSNSGDASDKEQTVARWRAGEHRIIVATSAFSTGVDYPCVRAVIHQELPTSAIDFAQEVGRAGRDGNGGTSYLILPSTYIPIDDHTWHRSRFQTAVAQRVMQRYVSGVLQCHHAILSRFLDGPSQMQYCASTTAYPCAACLAHGVFDPVSSTDHTLYWDSVAVDHRPPSLTQSSPPDEHQGDDTGAPDTDDPDSPDTGPDVVGGSQRLRQFTRVTAEDYTLYLDRCRRWHPRCWPCFLINGTGEHHTLDNCPIGQHKWGFINAKRDALERNEPWIPQYVACFTCAQPQSICNGRTPGQCEFKDLVLPLAWALFHTQNRWGQSLESITGPDVDVHDEAAYMAWLGKECDLFGDRAINAVRIAEWAMRQLVQGERAEPVAENVV